MTKLNLTRLCLVTMVAAVVLMDGIVCPFPEDDPRSVFNPFIVPWWRHAPRPVRSFLHRAVTGQPLPPNDLQNLPPVRPLFRFRRPAFRAPRLRLRRPLLQRPWKTFLSLFKKKLPHFFKSFQQNFMCQFFFSPSALFIVIKSHNLHLSFILSKRLLSCCYNNWIKYSIHSLA